MINVKLTHEYWKQLTSIIKHQLQSAPSQKNYQSQYNSALLNARQKLDKSKSVFLDTKAFFDSVVLYQHPDIYAGLFNPNNRPYNQLLPNNAEYVIPEALENKGGFAYIDGFCGAYSVKQIHHLLESLQRKLTQNKIEFPMGFILCSHNHAFTIGFDPKHSKWLLIEADNGPVQLLGNYALASKINKLFSTNENTIFDTKIFTTGLDRQKALNVINIWKSSPEFKSIQAIDNKKASLMDSDACPLLYIAAQNGRLETIKALLDSGADIDYAAPGITSALYVASSLGHIDVVKELLQRGAYVHADYYTGVSPLIVAASKKNFAIMHLLRDYGADLFEIINDKELIKQFREYKNDRVYEERKTLSR
jgi:hypothetical protein